MNRRLNEFEMFVNYYFEKKSGNLIAVPEIFSDKILSNLICLVTLLQHTNLNLIYVTNFLR